MGEINQAELHLPFLQIDSECQGNFSVCLGLHGEYAAELLPPPILDFALLFLPLPIS
jgi:hypothetical protein